MVNDLKKTWDQQKFHGAKYLDAHSSWPKAFDVKSGQSSSPASSGGKSDHHCCFQKDSEILSNESQITTIPLPVLAGVTLIHGRNVSGPGRLVLSVTCASQWNLLRQQIWVEGPEQLFALLTCGWWGSCHYRKDPWIHLRSRCWDSKHAQVTQNHWIASTSFSTVVFSYDILQDYPNFHQCDSNAKPLCDQFTKKQCEGRWLAPRQKLNRIY